MPKQATLPQGVFQKPGSTKLWIRYTDANGKQQRVSSGTDDVAQALALLNERKAAAQGNHDAPVLVPSKQQTSSTGTTLQDLYAMVVRDYKLNGRSSIATIGYRWQALEAHFGADADASTITAEAIDEYIGARNEAGKQNGTINRELALLGRCFKLGMKRRKVSAVPAIELLEENNAREGFVEPEEYSAIVAQLPKYLKCIYVCAYHTGVRKGELLSVRVEQVDMQAHEIRLEGSQTKNGIARNIPFAEMPDVIEALTWQLDYCARFGSTMLFHEDGRAPMLSFYKAWKSAVKRAGIKRDVHFHDTRRSAVRNMDRAGVPQTVAMQISGHKTPEVYRRYNITSTRDMGDAASRIGKHLQSRGATGHLQMDAQPRPITSTGTKLRDARRHEECSSTHRGVSYDAQRGKWRAQISVGGRKVNLGRYETEAEAAAAYEAAVREQRIA